MADCSLESWPRSGSSLSDSAELEASVSPGRAGWADRSSPASDGSEALARDRLPVALVSPCFGSELFSEGLLSPAEDFEPGELEAWEEARVDEPFWEAFELLEFGVEELFEA